MSQVDFVNYFSILFWFFFLFVLYYLINYSLLLPLIFSTLKVRKFVHLIYLQILKYKFNNKLNLYCFYFFMRNYYIITILLLKKSVYIK